MARTNGIYKYPKNDTKKIPCSVEEPWPYPADTSLSSPLLNNDRNDVREGRRLVSTDGMEIASEGNKRKRRSYPGQFAIFRFEFRRS